MKFFGTVFSLTLAAAKLTNASPIEARQNLDTFLLETQVVPGNYDCGSNKGGLYIFSYHTGAGLGIAAGSPEPTSGTHFYLNDTTLTWTYDGNEIGPWKTSIIYGPYQCKPLDTSNTFSMLTKDIAFNPISISIATDDDATPGFSISGNVLTTNATEGGWLVCDSWYQSPQLFAIEYTNLTYPSSCSFVNLLTVPAPESSA